MNKKTQMDLVIQLLSYWKVAVQLNNALNYNDINKLAEGLAAKLLNRVYNLQLINLNKEVENFPSIDLGDKINKVAYQITSRTDANKVRDNLKGFVDKKYNGIYTSGLFFFIITDDKEKIKFGRNAPNKIYGSFDAKKHIITLRDLIKEIENIYDNDYDRFKSIRHVLQHELGNINEGKKENLESLPFISFSFRGSFHLKEADEEIAIFLQNSSRKFKQGKENICEIVIEEESSLLDIVKEMEQKSSKIEDRKKIENIKDILFAFSKIKEELIFKVKALIETKICCYDYMGFEPFVKSFLELMKDLWQGQLIMEETYAMNELQTKFIKGEVERHKGNIKLWIKCSEGFGFGIWEDKKIVEKIFKKYSPVFDIEDQSDVIISDFWAIEVSDLSIDSILSKVIPGFVDELYHSNLHKEKSVASIKDTALLSCGVLID